MVAGGGGGGYAWQPRRADRGVPRHRQYPVRAGRSVRPDELVCDADRAGGSPEKLAPDRRWPVRRRTGLTPCDLARTGGGTARRAAAACGVSAESWLLARHLNSVRVERSRDTHRCSTRRMRSEEHTSELQSLMRIPYAVFCFKKQNTTTTL